jgi:hypothetical protein
VGLKVFLFALIILLIGAMLVGLYIINTEARNDELSVGAEEDLQAAGDQPEVGGGDPRFLDAQGEPCGEA